MCFSQKKFMKTVTVIEILNHLTERDIPHQYRGSESAVITGYSSLAQYRPGTLAWVKTPEKLREGPKQSEFALLIAQSGVEVSDAPCVITSPESRKAFFSVIEHFYGDSFPARPSCGYGSFISPKVQLGRNVTIGCGCVLDGEITVGDDTVIWHNVTILNRVTIGRGCVIQSGVVIGHDGYAFTEKMGRKTMIPHYGGVSIGNDVWIGSNTDIIRGTIDDTCIGDGCKIDTLCHIAHNVIMERDCALVSGSIMMGSVHLNPRTYVASAIVRDQVHLGSDSFVGMGAAVTKDVPDETVVAGIPAKPFKKLNA